MILTHARKWLMLLKSWTKFFSTLNRLNISHENYLISASGSSCSLVFLFLYFWRKTLFKWVFKKILYDSCRSQHPESGFCSSTNCSTVQASSPKWQDGNPNLWCWCMLLMPVGEELLACYVSKLHSDYYSSSVLLGVALSNNGSIVLSLHQCCFWKRAWMWMLAHVVRWFGQKEIQNQNM